MWLFAADVSGTGRIEINTPFPVPGPDPEIDNVNQRIAYLYSQNTIVSLSVVGSGGNLGTISDRRIQAGASTTQAGSYASTTATPDISSVITNYARITQTVGTPPTLPADTNNTRFPLLHLDTAGQLQAMNYQEMIDFFIAPVVANMTSGTLDAKAGGMYHINTSSSVAGSTLVSATPVFTDTRANAAAYTAGGIGEVQDQPTTINNYYLHKVTPAANSPTYMPIYWDDNDGWIKTMPNSMFDDIFTPMIQNYIVNGSGEADIDLKIRYNLNGTGTTMGSVMTDTYLNGSSVAGYTQRFVSLSDYRTQEFPNGTPVTNASHTLKSVTSN